MSQCNVDTRMDSGKLLPNSGSRSSSTREFFSPNVGKDGLGKPTSLADRIKSMRQTNYKLTTEDVPRKKNIEDVQSLVLQYREILDSESRLSGEVLRSIAYARLYGKRVKRRIYHDSDTSTYYTASSGTPQPNSSSASSLSVFQQNTSDASLLSLTTGKEKGNSRVRGRTILSDVIKPLNMRCSSGIAQQPIRTKRMVSTSKMPEVSLISESYPRKLKKEIIAPKHKSPSLLLNHLIDAADNSYEEVLNVFNTRPNTKSVGTQTIAEIDRHYQHSNRTCDKPAPSLSDSKLPQENHPDVTTETQPISSATDRNFDVRMTRVPTECTSKASNRCYQFVGLSLTRSMSLPTLKDISGQNKEHLLKDYAEADVDTLMYGAEPKEVLTLPKASKTGEGDTPVTVHKEDNSSGTSRGRCLGGNVLLPRLSAPRNLLCPIGNTNIFDKRPYLRSDSCKDLQSEGNVELPNAPIPRLVTFYRDLKSFASFSTEGESTLKMTVKTRNRHHVNLTVFWGSQVDEEKLSLSTKPSYVSDTRCVGITGSCDVRNLARPPKKFLYPQVIPVKSVHVAGSGADHLQCFMESVGKTKSQHRFPVKSNYCRYHKRCVPDKQWKSLRAQTKHHFVPWH